MQDLTPQEKRQQFEMITQMHTTMFGVNGVGGCQSTQAQMVKDVALLKQDRAGFYAVICAIPIFGGIITGIKWLIMNLKG